MKNFKIILKGGNYSVYDAEGKEVECKRYFEKSRGVWHVSMKKDGKERIGAEFVRESLLNNYGADGEWIFPYGSKERRKISKANSAKENISKFAEDEKIIELNARIAELEAEKEERIKELEDEELLQEVRGRISREQLEEMLANMKKEEQEA